MKIAFFSPHLCLRGTTVAMHDYSFYNQEILGNESVAIHERDHQYNNETVIEKFEKHTQVISIDGIGELDSVLEKEKCDAVYIIKTGKNDERIAHACKTLIHCVGMQNDPHGDVYAYVSKWLSDACSGGNIPYVPYMTDLPNVDEDLRGELGIPEDAIVFGRSGGHDTWNLPFANPVIDAVLRNNPNIYFLFQNTPVSFRHNRILHIEKKADLIYKTKFINSCDAMIHARHEGESFGLACAEFSLRNKPVITWLDSKERNHIEVLGSKGIYYSSPRDMFDALCVFKKEPEKDWNCYRDFNPEDVMKKFKEVYLC
jgi:hypothetical protein